MMTTQGFSAPMAQNFQAQVSQAFMAPMGTPAPTAAALPPPGPPPSAATASATPAPADSPSAALIVPGEGIARVIGKAGANLKQIRESSGVKLIVQEAGSDRSSARRVDLVGSPASIGAAAGQVLGAVANQQSGSMEASIMIPNKIIGSVIGKGGEKLKLVRENTGVRIQVERDPITNPASGEEERMITATGDPMAIGNALSLALGGPSMALHSSFGLMRPGTGRSTGAPVLGGVAPPLGTTLPGSSSSPLSDVHNMPDDPEIMQVHLVIPGKLTGAIVGKQGATIQQIATQSGCQKVSVTNRANSADRRVVCIGGMSQVQAAQQLVHSTAMLACESAGVDGSHMAQVTTIFWIPREMSGAVIGKQGATLGAIREQAGVKIQFGKEEIKNMRPCSITGTLQSVVQAQTLIHKLIVQEQQTKGLGGPDDVRIRSTDQTTKLLVPARSAGAIIGKAGMGLARIREDCGVKIEVLAQAQAPHWVEDRVVILQGPLASRKSAVAAVLQLAFPPEEIMQATLKMLVSRGEAGAIIGKQGNTLKHLREQSGLSVQVQKDDILGERLVTSTGPMSTLLPVARMILDSIVSPAPSPSA